MNAIQLAVSLLIVSSANAVPTVNNIFKPRTFQTCSAKDWDNSIDNWVDAQVDDNFATWWNGGVDSENQVWTPQSKSDDWGNHDKAFLYVFGTTLADDGNLDCDVGSHDNCGAKQCDEMGQNAKAGNYSKWAYYTMTSISHLSGSFKNLYDALDTSQSNLNSINMNLVDTFADSKHDQEMAQGVLDGISTFLGILSVALPVAAPALAAVKAGEKIAEAATTALDSATSAVDAASSYISTNLKSDDPMQKVSALGTFIKDTADKGRSAIDSMSSSIFKGETVSGTNIQSLLKGGGYVNPTSTSMSDLTDAFTKDMTARAINQLWSQYKIWVAFADLGDDASKSKCNAHNGGPQSAKYCGDGGVYYLYHFDETGHLKGKLDGPKGWDSLDDFSLQASYAVESSARSYRSQNGGAGGFSYNADGGKSSVMSKITKGDVTDIVGDAGKMEGVWTLPVCDMGKHDWHYDWENNKGGNPHGFPCMCGSQGSQTKDFISASQMYHFQTIWEFCKDLFHSEGYPDDAADTIDFGSWQIHR